MGMDIRLYRETDESNWPNSLKLELAEHFHGYDVYHAFLGVVGDSLNGSLAGITRYDAEDIAVALETAVEGMKGHYVEAYRVGLNEIAALIRKLGASMTGDDERLWYEWSN